VLLECISERNRGSTPTGPEIYNNCWPLLHYVFKLIYTFDFDDLSILSELGFRRVLLHRCRLVRYFDVHILGNLLWRRGDGFFPWVKPLCSLVFVNIHFFCLRFIIFRFCLRLLLSFFSSLYVIIILKSLWHFYSTLTFLFFFLDLLFLYFLIYLWTITLRINNRCSSWLLLSLRERKLFV